MARTRADHQTSLRLPTALLRRLQEAAEGRGRGLGQEIVERLERSFSGPWVTDPKLGDLLAMISYAAIMLATNWVPFHEDIEAFEVFKAAVAALIDFNKPDKSGAPKSRQAEVMFGGPDAGERLAMMINFRAP